MGIKVYKEGSFVDANFIRRYNGSSWIDIAGGNDFVSKNFNVRSTSSAESFKGTSDNTIRRSALIIDNLGFVPVTVCCAIEVGDITTVLSNQTEGVLRLLAYHWSGNPMYATEQFRVSELPSFDSNKIILPIYNYNTVFTVFVTGYK